MDDVMKGNWGFVQFIFAVSIVLCVFLYAPGLFLHIPFRTIDIISVDPSSSSSSVPGVPSAAAADGGNAGDRGQVVLDNQVHSPCSTMRNDTICCDRSDFNSDVCFMVGDVRTDEASLSLLLLPPPQSTNVTGAGAANKEEEERMRPYTRKWERFIMGMIPEVRLRRPDEAEEQEHHHHRCDVRHDAPVLVMTAGGYTGNFFHTFNDGFLPAWLTVQHLRRRVVLGVLSYNPWWADTFRQIISGLSGHPVVDLQNDHRTHCFPGAIVGTRFHDLLAVDPARLRDNKTIVDFHGFLACVYDVRSSKPEEDQPGRRRLQPRLGIVSRKGTRVIENQAAVAELATSVGFDVDILETANETPLSTVYRAVSACDALVGVHGSDLTRFLFLRPGRAWLTQISPLGILPIARDCFGKPAARMGLRYEQYEVCARESSLSRRYAADDVVVADPEEAKRGRDWDFVAEVYLKGQNVTLDLGRFRETLARMHAAVLSSRRLEQQQPGQR